MGSEMCIRDRHEATAVGRRGVHLDSRPAFNPGVSRSFDHLAAKAHRAMEAAMKLRPILLAVALASPALASQPGQSLDCRTDPALLPAWMMP